MSDRPTDATAVEVHLVRVLTDNREQQVWIVAAAEDSALSLVLDAVPDGWSASLMAETLTPQEIASLQLQPGDIRQLGPRSS